MRVRALKGFVGETCMAIGEEKEIPNEKAERLIAIGYVEAVTPSPEKPAKKSTKKAMTEDGTK